MSVRVMECMCLSKNSYARVLVWLDLEIRPFKEIRLSEAESSGGSQEAGEC